MKIGILGTGNIGATLATKLSAAGHEVKVANSRGPETIDVGILKNGARAVTAAEAVTGVDVVIMSTPLGALPKIGPLVAVLPEDVIVIDTSNYYPARDTEIGAIEAGMPITPIGRGRVIAGTDVEAALQNVGIAPDFTYAKPAPDSDVQFVHRSMADGDVYFVNNRINRPERIEARFRVAGKVPELWRADTGETSPLDYRIENGTTVVSLDMSAEDSFFVVFRKTASPEAMSVTRVTTH